MKSSNLFGGFIFLLYLCSVEINIVITTKTATNMITVMTKNGVKLYISLTDDCGENKGGYFCQVYLDEDYEFEYDNFVIHRDDNRTIEECCIAYANEFDDMPIINKRMNEVYESISDSYVTAFQFFLHHIATNKNITKSERDNFKELIDKMIDVKNLAQEITEHYTWD